MWTEVEYLQIKMLLKYLIGTLLNIYIYMCVCVCVVSISKCTKVVTGESSFDIAMKTMLQRIHVNNNNHKQLQK